MKSSSLRQGLVDLQVKAALREPAQLVSKVLQLDQVQSYILLVRLLSQPTQAEEALPTAHEPARVKLSPAQQIAEWGDGGVLTRAMSLYYLERTCLLSSMCTLISSCALVEPDQLDEKSEETIRSQLGKLREAGLEEKLVAQLQKRLEDDKLPEVRALFPYV